MNAVIIVINPINKGVNVPNIAPTEFNIPTCEAKGSEMASTRKDRIMSSG